MMITLIVIKGLFIIAIIIIPWIIIGKHTAAEDIVLEAELEQIAISNKVREAEILRGMQEHDEWRDKLMGGQGQGSR